MSRIRIAIHRNGFDIELEDPQASLNTLSNAAAEIITQYRIDKTE